MNPTLWIPAVWAQYRAGNLTPLFRDVLLRLQKFDRGRGLWPAHDTLAEAARCSVRTVQDALAQGRRLGLLDWVSGAGRRTSNRYSLTLPKVAVEAGVRLGRAASRAVAKVAALGRALVGRMREEGEQTASNEADRAGEGMEGLARAPGAGAIRGRAAGHPGFVQQGRGTNRHKDWHRGEREDGAVSSGHGRDSGPSMIA